MTGIRQIALVVAVGVVSFGALFAVASASDDSNDAPVRAAKKVRLPEPAAPATVNVATIGKAAALPAMRRKAAKASPAPAPVVEEAPVTPTVEPEPTPTYTPPPTYSPPPSPAPSNPSPPPSDPGQSFDDSG